MIASLTNFCKKLIGGCLKHTPKREFLIKVYIVYILRKKIQEQLKLYDQSQGGQSKTIHQTTHRQSCCCCCNCESDEGENEEIEEKVEVTKSEVKTKEESFDKNEKTVEKVESENVEETNFDSNEVEEIKSEKTTEKKFEDYESGNYKIAYCCCGKDCHTKAFSSSLTDLRETGPSTKYDINYVKPRRPRSTLTRSKSALETSRSRSRSAKSKSPSSRPPWIPTGANQYYNTHYARSNLMSGQKYAHDSSTMPIQSSVSQTKTSCDKSVNTSNQQHQPATYYTYQSYEPSKTTIKTTIDSKSYVKPIDGHYQYYNVVSEKNLPKIEQKYVNYECGKGTISSNNYIRPLSASASYSYTKTQNPHYSEVKSINHAAKHSSYYNAAPNYVNTNYQKAVSDHYQPVDSTFKGKLYSKNNEIHYVSDNASRSWNSNKNPHVRIVNAGTTVIHE
jgi:hypothetical protein